jgi:cbb3-type cytochrome c oxidase subunit III
MQKRPPHRSQKATFSQQALALFAVLALSIVVSGCGNNSKTDLVNGKTLFIAKCGGCHTLARAGTAGAQGPDLDDAFRQSREDGMGSTIQGVVKEQIALPSSKLYPADLNMPANLVEGMDAEDVAAYVSYAAAKPGKDTGALAAAGGGTDGKGLFKTNCGSCHTLADAGTSGTIGPNLDSLKPNLALVTKQVINGGGGMPAFGGTLDDKQIALIAKYVSSVAGK